MWLRACLPVLRWCPVLSASAALMPCFVCQCCVDALFCLPVLRWCPVLSASAALMPCFVCQLRMRCVTGQDPQRAYLGLGGPPHMDPLAGYRHLAMYPPGSRERCVCHSGSPTPTHMHGLTHAHTHMGIYSHAHSHKCKYVHADMPFIVF